MLCTKMVKLHLEKLPFLDHGEELASGHSWGLECYRQNHCLDANLSNLFYKPFFIYVNLDHFQRNFFKHLTCDGVI